MKDFFQNIKRLATEARTRGGARLAAEERPGACSPGLRRSLPLLLLAAISAANGFLALWLSACSCAPLAPADIWDAYFARPSLILLNVLPPVLLAALGFFLTGRGWAAYLISAVPTFGFALANYYKIQLRGDPLLVSDLRLIRTAGGIVGHYQLDPSPVVLLLAGGVVLRLLLCLIVPPERPRGWKPRLFGTLASLALIVLLCMWICGSGAAYLSDGSGEPRAAQVDAETYVSRGFWYSFLYSLTDARTSAPENYSSRAAKSLLARYETADIPEERKVQVVSIMLEAFCDLTDFPMLARQEGVAAVYAPLHELESRAVSGGLLTNTFAGGTVNTEWAYLTGYSRHGEFTADLDTYVRYFNSQGYDTVYNHPGYSWFYDREHINRWLGFDESVFTENGFGALVDPDTAIYRSDAVLFDYLLDELSARTAKDAPLFSFSVTYQNHGPYASEPFEGAAVTPEDTGWSEESCGILSHYLYNVEDTIAELCRFTDELDKLDEPVVLVLFGDHKPWLGNDKAVYLELGVNLDLDTQEGFRNVYTTPYLIWANRAAKRTLDRPFTGDGGDFSPCFLMEELFDCCGWDGPAFLQLARDMRARSPLLHWRDCFFVDGAILTRDEIPEDVLSFYRDYRGAEYWRELHGLEE